MPKKLRYSLLVLIAGISYGVMVPLVRIAYGGGFDTSEIMVTQYLVAVIAMALLCLLFSRKKVAFKDALKLIGIGIVSAAACYSYYQALKLLSPAAALTLLFQFVWMGLVVQAVRTRRAPKLTAFLAVILVVVGAVFATGLLDEGFSMANLDPLGIFFGLLSAVCYTIFLVLTGITATSVPALNRTLFITLGCFLTAFALVPTYFAHPMIVLEPAVGVVLGALGICVPICLINISSPRLPTGLTGIMLSSELPSGVILAAIFVGVPVTLTTGIGVVFVLLGIVVSEIDTLASLARRSGRSP